MKKIINLILIPIIIASCSSQVVKEKIVTTEEIKIKEKNGVAKLNADGSPENLKETEKPIEFKPTSQVINLPTEQQILDAQKPRPTFDQAYPYSQDKTNGIFIIFFKDNFNIRYYSEKGIFVSKTGENLKTLNDFIKSKKIEFFSGNDMSKPIDSFGNSISEEKLESKELADKLLFEKNTGNGYYYPNKLSIYKILFKDINIKEIIEPLRKEKYILSANFSADYIVPSPTPKASSSPVINNGVNYCVDNHDGGAGVVVLDSKVIRIDEECKTKDNFQNGIINSSVISHEVNSSCKLILESSLCGYFYYKYVPVVQTPLPSPLVSPIPTPTPTPTATITPVSTPLPV